MEIPDVRPGQIWADNDWRSAGRTIRVLEIVGDKALCQVVTNSDDVQQKVDHKSPWVTDRRGKNTGISLRRFRPTSTGYRLVQNADRPAKEA